MYEKIIPGEELSDQLIFFKEWRSIKRPKFLLNLPDRGMMICKPLSSFLSGFAVTHTGVVFNYKNIRSVISNFNSVTLHPRIINGHPVVTLHRENKSRTFLVNRIMLGAFYDINLTDRVSVEFIDGDSTNMHYLNLEVVFR